MDINTQANYNILAGEVRKALLSLPTWTISAYLAGQDRSPETLEANYAAHFSHLSELAQDENTAAGDLFRRRLEFVSATYHSTMVDEFFLRQSVGSLGLPALITAILWQSRSDALIAGDIDKHIRMSQLMAHPMLSQAPRRVAAEITSMTNAGITITCAPKSDKRQKWVALSADTVFACWERALTWFLVRLAILSRLERQTETADRNNWTRDLGMPVEIFDLAFGMDWQTKLAKWQRNGQ